MIEINQHALNAGTGQSASLAVSIKEILPLFKRMHDLARQYDKLSGNPGVPDEEIMAAGRMIERLERGIKLSK